MLMNDKLDALIMLSAQVLVDMNNKELLETDTSDVVVPKSLDRRINRLINRERRKREYGRLFAGIKRVAVVFLVVCTVSFAMFMSVESIRKAVWNAIVEFYREYFAVTYVSENQAPERIEIKREPRNIPEDWERKIGLETNEQYKIWYWNDGKIVMFYKQTCLDKTFWGDNENTILEKVYVNENEGFLTISENNDEYFLKWQDGEYCYLINVFLNSISKEEVIKIAESVK